MLILAVEQDQVGERFRWEWWILKQEVQLLEPSARLLLNVHQCRVMKRHWIQLILVPRRHVHESLSGRGRVLHRVLNGSLEVESFDQGRFFQRLSIADTLDLDALRVGANAKLRMFSYSFFNDISNMLE